MNSPVFEYVSPGAGRAGRNTVLVAYALGQSAKIGQPALSVREIEECIRKELAQSTTLQPPLTYEQTRFAIQWLKKSQCLVVVPPPPEDDRPRFKRFALARGVRFLTLAAGGARLIPPPPQAKPAAGSTQKMASPPKPNSLK